jgi:adenylylsulfate kinase-like enzyme
VNVGRDTKGLYKRALAGEIDRFAGISDPYEPPFVTEVTLRTARETKEESVAKILEALQKLELVAS